MAETSLLFMQVTGPKGAIHGDCLVRMSPNKDYRRWIDIDNWRWSQKKGKKATDAKADGASNTPQDIVEPSPFTFSKLTDSATTELLNAMSRGDALQVRLVLEDASQNDLFELTVRLKDARITQYEVSVRVRDKQLEIEEEWTFDYAEIVFELSTRDTDGKKYGPFNSEALKRPAGASPTRTESKKTQLMKLALEFPKADLKKIWEEIEARLDHEKAPLPATTEHK
jgi:type VI protein secretion system component Hcp